MDSNLEIPITAVVNVAPAFDAAFIQLQNEVSNIVKWAEDRVVANQEDAGGATNDLSIVKKLKKALEDKRKEYIQPLRDYTDQINDTFKQLSEPLNQADKVLQDKIMGYQRELARIKTEQEEINRLRMLAAQKDQDLHGELSESVNLVEVVEAPTKVNAEMGSAGQKANWKWEVTDFALVSDEYKVIDGPQLTTIAKSHHDQKLVPGVRFYNEPILAVRSR